MVSYLNKIKEKIRRQKCSDSTAGYNSECTEEDFPRADCTGAMQGDDTEEDDVA